MAEVIFVNNGIEKTTTLLVGDRLIKAAWKLNLEQESFAECGGNCICGTCHVFIKEGGTLFERPFMNEDMLLDTLPNVRPDSRLLCQLKVNKEHKRIKIEIA